MTDRSADRQPRLGILGGTFDPVHLGHLASARSCALAFGLERVLLVLSARPPHKPGGARASIEDRLRMLELAASGEPLVVVSELEVERAGPSYTSDTLAELARAHPAHDLYLIVGADAYAEIDSWHRPELLLERANLIVTSRPGADAGGDNGLSLQPPVAATQACCYDPAINGYVHSSGHRLIAHEFAGLDVSASEIREFAAAGAPLERLTGAAVAAYIRAHGLYGAAPR